MKRRVGESVLNESDHRWCEDGQERSLKMSSEQLLKVKA